MAAVWDGWAGVGSGVEILRCGTPLAPIRHSRRSLAAPWKHVVAVVACMASARTCRSGADGHRSALRGRDGRLLHAFRLEGHKPQEQSSTAGRTASFCHRATKVVFGRVPVQYINCS